MNSCEGTAALEWTSGHAGNEAPNNSAFAGAITNGGWSEILTVSNPALTGQTGFMQFTLDVNGWLSGAGFAGSAGFLRVFS